MPTVTDIPGRKYYNGRPTRVNGEFECRGLKEEHDREALVAFMDDHPLGVSISQITNTFAWHPRTANDIMCSLGFSRYRFEKVKIKGRGKVMLYFLRPHKP